MNIKVERMSSREEKLGERGAKKGRVKEKRAEESSAMERDVRCNAALCERVH